MAWTRKALLRSTIPGPQGPIGLPGVNAVANDTATAGYVSSLVSQTFLAIAALFARKRGLDPRDFGAIGDGVADDTSALQACINAAGASGVVVLPPGIFKVTAPLALLAGTEIQGAGVKASELRASTDISILIAAGGQGQAIRRMLIRNTKSGTRSTYDIDFTSPTKPVLEDVEVSLPNDSTGGGGIRFRKDIGVAGNSFMPQLARVWVRNGHVIIDGVTDGHFVDGYVWAPGTGARAAVDMSNIANGWTFSAVDVVPTTGDGSGYRIEQTWDTNIIGGYIDGSYTEILTGYGVRMINAGQLFMSATRFYHLGRSGIRMENSHGSTVSAIGFQRNNKQDNFYPDIDLVGSNSNTFLGAAHSQRVVRTNKGATFREDAASQHNLVDGSAINLDGGNNYAAPVAIANPGTLGKTNRPGSLWPRPSGVPQLVAPPACLITLAAAATWPLANRGQFHRFHVTDGAVFRYANVRVETGSGNIQAAVVAMDGLNYTRVMASASIACTTAMPAIDMGATYLAPGEYALVVWLDNATAQLRLANDEAYRATRLVAEATLAAGVPVSGAITGWNSSARVVTGATITA